MWRKRERRSADGKSGSGRSSESFELISESLNLFEEAVYPPPQHPVLGPFHLKIPAPLPPPPPPTAPPEVVCRQCPPEDSVCFSCHENDDDDNVCDMEYDDDDDDDGDAWTTWNSDSTSQVELSFATKSLFDDQFSRRGGGGGGGGVGEDSQEAAAKLMVESFKRRLEIHRQRSSSLSSSSSSSSLSSSSSSSSSGIGLNANPPKAKSPFCAVPLRVLGRGRGLEKDTALREDICRLAYVEELIASKAGGGGKGRGWFGSKDSRYDWNPFLCEGKVLSLSVDDGLTGFGDISSSSSSSFASLPSSSSSFPPPFASLPSSSSSSSGSPIMSDYLVTPRFDMTLEEYMQQGSDCTVENRVLLFLQSLEAVAGLHSRGLAHGSVSASNFFIDLQENGRHRMLLSDFSKTGVLTEERKKADSWQLGRLGLRLFDDDVEDGGSGSVVDLPVLGADAPLEMDILVHSLMSNDAAHRISPSIAANMLHLYFWRNDLKSAISSSSSSSPSSPAGLSSQAFQTAKKNALNSLVDGGRVGVGTGCDASDADDDVKMDLRRSLFRRASFDDILHADELWRRRIVAPKSRRFGQIRADRR